MQWYVSLWRLAAIIVPQLTHADLSVEAHRMKVKARVDSILAAAKESIKSDDSKNPANPRRFSEYVDRRVSGVAISLRMLRAQMPAHR